MKEAGLQAGDQWKEKYNGCIREIDQLEIELDNTKQSYIKGVKRLAKIIPNPDTATQQSIDELQQSTDGQAFQQADQCLQTLTDFLFKLEVSSLEESQPNQEEKPLSQFFHELLSSFSELDLPASLLSDWQSKFNEENNLSQSQIEDLLLKTAQDSCQQHRDTLQKLRLYFEQLLQGLPVTGSVVKNLNRLIIELTSTAPELDQLTDFFQSAITLIKQMSLSIRGEQQQTEAFLKQLSNRLMQINSCMEKFGGGIEETVQLGHLISTQFEETVESLRVSVDESETLDELKNNVLQGLDTFNIQFGNYQEKERVRYLQLRTDNNKVMEQLAALEKQRKTLSDAVLKERQNATQDRLTKLNNRWSFDAQLDINYKEWKAGETSLVVAFFDIDHFKKINDTYGHKVGDQVLKAVASILKKGIEQTGFLARYGGEEFIALFTEKTIDEVFTLVEKLRENIASKKFKSADTTINMTLSCGIAAYKKGDALDAGIVTADQALYQAKDKGRNQTLLAD